MPKIKKYLSKMSPKRQTPERLPETPVESYDFLLLRKLTYRDLMKLKHTNRESNLLILGELKIYFKMIPDYIKRGREFNDKFEKYHNDIFIALQDIYPDSSLYEIISYLNTKEFKDLKRKTDNYIKINDGINNKSGVRHAVKEQLENNTLTPISLFDTKNIKYLSFVFDSVHNFNKPLNLWDVSQVEKMHRMFYWSYYNQPLNLWDVSKVKDMERMFMQSKFNRPLNSWDVSNVETMTSMFYRSRFNKRLDNWDVGNVRNMSHMFYESKDFNNDSIKTWDVSNVRLMDCMFYKSKFTQDLSVIRNWKFRDKVIKDDMFGKMKPKFYLKNPLKIIK